MYKVRFHLGRGKHFMHWQVKSSEGVVSYVDPQDNQLALLGCKLSVQTTSAQKIHDGANKTVCAWIECEEVQVLSVDRIKPNEQDCHIRFNPRVNPNWIDDNNTIVSGDQYRVLFTNDRTLWAVSETYECFTEYSEIGWIKA